MFNFPNNQLLVPNGTQMQQPIGFQAQIPQPYLEQPAQMPYPNDTFMPITSDYTTPGKSFWDGFKLVFTKIGEFCTKNFGLILTGAGLLGGYKFCSSSMKTYEENKNNGKLDDKGNLKDKDASIKDTIMNFVGHGVHYVFGSNKAEDIDEESNETKKDVIDKIEQSNDDVRKELLTDLITNGQVSSLLRTFKNNPKILINILEVISENINTINKQHKFKRPENIIKALENVNSSSDEGIKERAQEVASKLKGNTTYFSKAQQDKLDKISNKNNEE